jgi:hypothetical protein
MNYDFLAGFFAGVGVMYLYKLILSDIIIAKIKKGVKNDINNIN